MQETVKGDFRIYVVLAIFFVSIVTGGVFLCLYMFQPEEQSMPWYSIVGIVLVGIPWIFWIATYIYRCIAHCFCASNGGHVQGEHGSVTKKKSYASEGHARRSMHSSENGGSPPGTPDGDQRHVHFGDVVMVGSNGEKMLQEAQQFSNGFASDEEHIAAASPKVKEPLIVSDSP
ncbi:hypothetical protein F3Y22_tig00016066pilonHSYRG00057 [Hibiscus syriacus]|uniref:Uncharacterized protein n=1 Tax=Hibiscus syriacus TaxID=106335 RepID=A0A6A3C2K0_HIBSY|nr:uncharacterized protein LOC120208234 [Hibiscus syriacus]KAE8721402.1 hypothetical protein F3Y22_tig00016066pilonHSYRG00057 [Hibiscus syriacus]